MTGRRGLPAWAVVLIAFAVAGACRFGPASDVSVFAEEDGGSEAEVAESVDEETAQPPVTTATPSSAPVASVPEEDDALEAQAVAVGGETTVPPTSRPVYLTFDDGPHPAITPQVLDVLARHSARATFFVTGRRAALHPEIIERIVTEGHTVANHTWAHRTADELTDAEFRRSVQRTQLELGEHATPCFRPPEFRLGENTRGILADLGLRLVMTDANPRDWQQPGAAALADRLVSAAAPGVIIVLHDGLDRLEDQNVQALDAALSRLSGSGLRFEPVCEVAPK